ncbi:hypothetical protein BaRGS_00016858 [Batillaria attramentaria]|uniref:IMS import disulfide relay-system CHCH-CHCH-like Cx9C domain-containing protein n=1 Tax=Batillaria attramentaria TaxID=370345 RepID=A0ABD0KXF8_9CAEN
MASTIRHGLKFLVSTRTTEGKQRKSIKCGRCHRPVCYPVRGLALLHEFYAAVRVWFRFGVGIQSDGHPDALLSVAVVCYTKPKQNFKGRDPQSPTKWLAVRSLRSWHTLGESSNSVSVLGVFEVPAMSKSVASARQRMQQYPQALLQCPAQALAYGKCVAAKENVTKHVCDKEFQALKECIQNAVSTDKKQAVFPYHV